MKKFRILSAFAAAVMLMTAAPICMKTADPFTITADAASKLAAPTGIKASTTDKTISLTWNAVKGASAYTIYSGTSTPKKYKTVTGTSCTIKDLKAGKQYKIYVVALVKSGKGYAEQTKSATMTVSTKRAAPAGITVQTTANSALIMWSGSYAADAYRVFRYDSKTGKYVKFKDTRTTSCMITGLKEGKTEKYKVAALVKENGKYALQTKSAAIAVTPKKAGKVDLPDFPAFGKSSKEVLKALGITNYTSTDSENGYTVYMCNFDVSSLYMAMLGSGELNAIFLLFDSNDRFFAGINLSTVNSVNVLAAIDQISAKNGKGTSYNDTVSMTVWEKDTYDGEFVLFESGLFIYGKAGMKYAPDSMKKVLTDYFSGNVTSATALATSIL